MRCRNNALCNPQFGTDRCAAMEDHKTLIRPQDRGSQRDVLHRAAIGFHVRDVTAVGDSAKVEDVVVNAADPAKSRLEDDGPGDSTETSNDNSEVVWLTWIAPSDSSLGGGLIWAHIDVAIKTVRRHRDAPKKADEE